MSHMCVPRATAGSALLGTAVCPAASSCRGGKAVEQRGEEAWWTLQPDCLASNLGPTPVTWASDFKLLVPQFPNLQDGANESTRFIGLLMTMTCITKGTEGTRPGAWPGVATTGVMALVILHGASALVALLLGVGRSGTSRGMCSHTVDPVGGVTPLPYHPAFSSMPPAWSLRPWSL